MKRAKIYYQGYQSGNALVLEAEEITYEYLPEGNFFCVCAGPNKVIVSDAHLVSIQIEEVSDQILISQLDYTRLVESDRILSELHAAGVDNWEGYEDAVGAV